MICGLLRYIPFFWELIRSNAKHACCGHLGLTAVYNNKGSKTGSGVRTMYSAFKVHLLLDHPGTSMCIIYRYAKGHSCCLSGRMAPSIVYEYT